MSFRVTDPFRGNEALAGAGEDASGKESGVCTDVGGVGEVDEGNQGCRSGGVEEGKEGGGGIVRLVDVEPRVSAEPLALCLRNESVSLRRIEKVYNGVTRFKVVWHRRAIKEPYPTAQDDRNEISTLENLFADIATEIACTC